VVTDAVQEQIRAIRDVVQAAALSF